MARAHTPGARAHACIDVGVFHIIRAVVRTQVAVHSNNGMYPRRLCCVLRGRFCEIIRSKAGNCVEKDNQGFRRLVAENKTTGEKTCNTRYFGNVSPGNFEAKQSR